MENTWELEIQRGWIIGLALTALLVVLSVTLTVFAALSPLSLLTFIMGLIACAAVITAIWLGYQLWSLVSASYEMDRNAITIHWGHTHHQIPMSSVRSVLSGSEIQNLHMRPGLRWPGYFVGFGDADDVGAVLFYSTSDLVEQVIIRTEGMTYAISPQDVEGFLQACRERLDMGPTQEIEEHSSYPGFLKWSIWKDRWALGLLSGSTALLLLLVGLLCWRYPYLPAEIPMRIAASGEVLLLAGAARIFYLAFLGVLFLLLNGILGLFLYHWERAVSYFLWGGLLTLQLGLWAAVLSILFR